MMFDPSLPFQVRGIVALLVSLSLCIIFPFCIPRSNYPTISSHDATYWKRSCMMQAVIAVYCLFECIHDMKLFGTIRVFHIILNTIIHLPTAILAICATVDYRNPVAAAVFISCMDVLVSWTLLKCIDRLVPRAWSKVASITYFAIISIATLIKIFIVNVRGDDARLLTIIYSIFFTIYSFCIVMHVMLILVVTLVQSDEKSISVADKRVLYTAFCLLLHIIALFCGAYLGASDGALMFPNPHGNIPQTIIISVILFVMSWIPWRLASKEYIESKRHLESKLEFISRLSYAIRNRFNILMMNNEAFSTPLEDLDDNIIFQKLGNVLQAMTYVNESCSVSQAVLADFRVCEAIFGGSTRQFAQKTLFFPYLKNCLSEFSKENTAANLRIYTHEREELLNTLTVLVNTVNDYGSFSYILSTILNAALIGLTDELSAAPVIMRIMVVEKIETNVTIEWEWQTDITNLFPMLLRILRPRKILYFRLEFSGGNINKNSFRFFERGNIHAASEFLPTHKKDSGLGFWITQEFVKVLDGSIELVCVDVPDPLSAEMLVSPTQYVSNSEERERVSEKSRQPRDMPDVVLSSSRSEFGVFSNQVETSCTLILDLPIVADEKGLFYSEYLKKLRDTGEDENACTNLVSAIVGQSKQVNPESLNPRGVDMLFNPDEKRNISEALKNPSESEVRAFELLPENVTTPPEEPINMKRNLSDQEISALPSQSSELISHGSAGNNSRAASLISFDDETPSSPVVETTLVVENLKVLIVDDSPMTQKLLSKMLSSKKGFVRELSCASDGVDAVALVCESMNSNDAFDLVLLDYYMPRMTGVEALKLFREQNFKGIVIGVTGMHEREYEEAFMANGADTVLVKPVNFVQLYDKIRELSVVRQQIKPHYEF